jgi:hypothetical protein
MDKSPAMQVFPELWNVVKSAALLIVTLPGVMVPVQIAGEISVPHTPDAQTGALPLQF